MIHASRFAPLRRIAAAAVLLLLPAISAAAQVTGGVTNLGTPAPAQPAPSAAPIRNNPVTPAMEPGTPPVFTPLPQVKLTPELAHLIELEARFSDDVANGGGKAFASWFAPDAVTLNNGQPAVLGQRDIAAHAQWDPKNYTLTWQPEGAQLSPSGDMGFTWGHYEATTIHPAAGQTAQSSGRYITIWKRMPNGDWKVALDASANDAGQDNLTGQRSAMPAP